MEIAGEGFSDTYGMTVGMVELVKSWTTSLSSETALIGGLDTNIVKNGRFENNFLGIND